MSGTYPSYDQIRTESSLEVYSPTEWRLSINGTQLGIDMGDRQRRRWTVFHRLTDAQFQTLVSLFDTNQSTTGAGNGSFTFEDQNDQTASPATTYNAEFLDRPRREWIGSDLYDVTVELIEVGS